ncbi:hypothetical protein KIH74_26420 [Kineosporia sp. J2-2]|uniref:MarR family transcriptional regulator n=1 Tax=Kineosporia corallincola TaxID=2835133 RepID=A0ABS5TR17_9ACTN|nr:hypothetical protein [Kineosporia corallincola]MBT0772509.1 hypothetical protein [Kineosporia corallincola]
MTDPSGPIETHPVFTAAVADLSEKHRDEVLAAFAAVEHSWQPLHESQILALRDATLRRALAQMLHPLGRTLVKVGPNLWTSGYRDDVARELSAEMLESLPLVDRAVFVLILIHSVAIPRSQGLIDLDTWISSRPTSQEELNRYSKLPRTAVRTALARLRAAGLVQIAPDRRPHQVKSSGSGQNQGASYLPGPQLARLTPAARRRLQEELILAAGADTPLAAAIRARRSRPDGNDAPAADPSTENLEHQENV